MIRLVMISVSLILSVCGSARSADDTSAAAAAPAPAPAPATIPAAPPSATIPAAPPPATATPVVAGWMFAGDRGRTGATSDPGPATAPGVVWSRPVERDLTTEPVVTVIGGRPVVLIGSGEEALALTAHDGKPLWASAAGMLVVASPTVADGRVFVHGLDGMLRIVDADTGAIVKDIEQDYNLESSGLVVDNLYVHEETSHGGGASRSRLHAMDISKRMDVWRRDYVGGTGRAPSTDGERIFVACTDAIRAYAVADGAELWKHSFPPHVRVYEPIAGEGRVFVSRGGYGPATIEALDPATGKVLWSKETAARIAAAPSLAGDELIVPLMNSTLARFSVGDGAALPAVKTPGRVDTRVVVASHRIYYAAGKAFGALDRATFKPIWSLEASGEISALAVFKGTLLVVRRDGFLDAVESAP